MVRAAAGSMSELKLDGGRTIYDLLLLATPSAVILVAPASCLSCEPLLAQWILAYQRKTPGIHLVMCRAPHPLERQRLARSRVKGWNVTVPEVCGPGVKLGMILYRNPDGVVVILPVPASERALAELTGA